MRKKSKTIIAAIFLLMIPGFLPAQTAEELEALLEIPAVSCSQAAYFVLASVNDGSADSDKPVGVNLPEDPFEQAMAKGWFREGTAPDDSVTLGKLSFLMMKAFGMRGGMMYAIIPGPRYAFRSMVSRSFIQGASDPAMKVSGERFLLILGNVIEAVGGEQ